MATTHEQRSGFCQEFKLANVYTFSVSSPLISWKSLLNPDASTVLLLDPVELEILNMTDLLNNRFAPFPRQASWMVCLLEHPASSFLSFPRHPHCGQGARGLARAMENAAQDLWHASRCRCFHCHSQLTRGSPTLR